MKRISQCVALCCVVALAGPVSAADTGSMISVGKMVVVAANDVGSQHSGMMAESGNEGSGAAKNDSNVQAQDVPMGQKAGGNTSLLPEEAGALNEGKLFGIQGGYFHPYVSLKEEYTDNLFNVDTDQTSNFLTTLSPGVWFALPRKKVIPITITPHNTSAGGLEQQLKGYEGTDRYQFYALAGADLKTYSENSDLNAQDYVAEGLGRYNMPIGLSLQLLDRYSVGHDRFDVGNATFENLRKFDTNLVMATADWDLSEKLRAKVDYSNFNLGYDKAINAFLERQDNSVDLYGYYNYSDKTSLFLQYRHTEVSYDSATEKDNSQDYVYGGISWNTTDKLSLLFKAGVQSKDFDTTATGFQASDELAVDLQTLYHFTVKTQASLNLYRAIEEPDSSVASQKIVLGARLNYTQKVTDKITGICDVVYENADYTQLIDSGREDDRYLLRPAMQYLFKDWLMGEMAYAFEKRDSTDDLFDYESNTVSMSLNFSL